MEVVGAEVRRVCVTGAGGYLASWLVKLLLSKRYTVHGTVRDPSDEKNAHLKKLEKADDHLQLFKADLLDYDAIASAIAGCEGVFHVASPLPSGEVPNPELEIIAPAITGTLNVLKACSEAKVKRVVVVSSSTAVFKSPNTVVDEDSWSDVEYCRNTECMDHSRCTRHEEKWSTQANVESHELGTSPNRQGARESIENRFIHIVDVRDVADALLLLYEKPEVSGGYICRSHRSSIRDLVDLLKSMYPSYQYPKEYIKVEEGGLLSNEKLKSLGWKSRTLKESLIDSVEYYRAACLLD